MMKSMKNERGYSLVELFISLAILSLIVILVTSIQLFGQKQVTNQNERANLQAEVRLALNVVTKEIRGAETLSIYNNIVTLNDGDVTIKKEGETITKNGQVIASKIEDFRIKQDANKVEIEVKSVAPKQGEPILKSTVIYLRN